MYQKNFVGIELFSPAKKFLFLLELCMGGSTCILSNPYPKYGFNELRLFLGNNCFLFLYKTDQDHFQ